MRFRRSSDKALVAAAPLRAEDAAFDERECEEEDSGAAFFLTVVTTTEDSAFGFSLLGPFGLPSALTPVVPLPFLASN